MNQKNKIIHRPRIDSRKTTVFFSLRPRVKVRSAMPLFKSGKSKLQAPKDPSARRIYWMNRLRVTREDGSSEELHPTPEVIAVALAKCSRSDTPFDQNVDDVSLEKAAEFHEKWVVGYGHGSVAEHAVSSVAVENVSQVAIKVLEDARLASFTEKSSRYQVFSRERAYTPEAIAKSGMAKEYKKFLDKLYELYEELFPKISALMKERFPKAEELAEKAYEAQTKARTLDVTRCLLPAEAFGSLGMTANARVWEYVISKCLSHPLEEVRGIGTELRNVLKGEPDMSPDVALQERPHPTLLKYAEEKPYLQEAPADLAALAKTILPEIPMEAPTRVIMQKDDGFAEARIAAALLYRVASVPFEVCYAKTKNDSPLCEKILRTALEKRGAHSAPLRELEHAVFTHEITMNYGAWRDIQRHRLCTQTNQPLSTFLGFDLPEEIQHIGYAERFNALMNEADRFFRALQEAGLDQEADYVVPMALRRRLLVSWNLRELFHFIELRSGIKGHPTYRFIAQEIWRTLNETHPLLASFIHVDLRGNEAGVSTLGAKPKGI